MSQQEKLHWYRELSKRILHRIYENRPCYDLIEKRDKLKMKPERVNDVTMNTDMKTIPVDLFPSYVKKQIKERKSTVVNGETGEPSEIGHLW